MDIVNGVIQILSCISTPSCNYLDRHMKFKRNVADLRKRVKDLNSRKEDIQAQLETVDLLVKQVKKQVEDWLGEVERINNVEMPGIEEEVQKVSYLCRGRIVRHVREMIEAVEAIYQQGNFLPEGLTIDKPRPPTIGTGFPLDNLEGEVDAKEQIWRYLNNDDVGLIGLWGIGGVGKTTIIKHIHNELVKMEPRRFDVVLWVTVSQPLSIRRLQHDIANKMQKSLPEDEEELMRAAKLMNIMGTMKFVLILDDVWDKLSLEDVGISKPTEENGCKVVVTSRSANVCNFMGCQLVKVNPLSSRESLNLFLDRVGLGSGVLEDSEFGNILRLVVNECAGLPLAIVVIAGTMKGVSDIREWRNALRELRDGVRGITIEDQNDKIFNRLKFSYDRLRNQNIQNCFLYCSLYREDYLFPRKNLIEDWIDEGLIEKLASREEMHDQGHSILNRLQNNCLLEKGYDEDYVKMHDVVRDMALRIKSIEPRYMVRAGMMLKKIPEGHEWAADLEKVSLMDNDIVDIPPNMSPNCSVLSTLLLQKNPSLKEIPECFFSNMPELKVLNLSNTNIESLPSSICNLKSLTSLILRDCFNLKHVPSLVELKALKKLDMKSTGISVVPEGIEMLVNLQYLDLFCWKLVELPVGKFCNFVHLQCLYLYGRIEGEELARLIELEHFTGLLDLEDFNNLVKDCKHFLTLAHYNISVGGRVGLPVVMRSNRIELMECEIGGENDSPLVLPDSLKELEISRCNILKGDLNNMLMQSSTLNQLQGFSIRDCNGIHCIVDLDSLSSPINFINNIESLFLDSLPALQALVKWVGPSATSASTSRAPTLPSFLPIFSNLTSIHLYSCSRMKKLIPVELLQCLQNLKNVFVWNCSEMEEIIGWGEEEFKIHTTTNATFTPRLEYLTLWDLPKLRRISLGREAVGSDSLKSIEIKNCPTLKRIPLYLDGNIPPSPSPALKEIIVWEKEWWESVEWDNPNAKNIFQPFLRYKQYRTPETRKPAMEEMAATS